MAIKSLVAGLAVAASMFAVVGTTQAAMCYHHHHHYMTSCFHGQSGWHMVSRHCNVPVAESWQEYTSGVYLQPMPRGMMLHGR